MSRTPKETVYDSRIAPLMARIIDICKKHKIAMLADFALGRDPTHDDDQLKCTSFLLTDDYEPDPDQLRAARIVANQSLELSAFIISKSTE